MASNTSGRLPTTQRTSSRRKAASSITDESQRQENQRHFESDDGQQGAFGEERTNRQSREDNRGAVPRRPSTRRNRDYSHHITWTYEL